MNASLKCGRTVISVNQKSTLLLRWIYLPLHPFSCMTQCARDIYYFHTFSFHLYPSGPLKIFQTELFWSPVQSKIQIIRGLTGRPIPTDPAPSFPELPLRISTVYPPSAVQRGVRGGICVIQKRVIRKEKRRKYHPLAQISVGSPLLGVSATCCAQLAKYTAMRNSLGRNRLVYK